MSARKVSVEKPLSYTYNGRVTVYVVITCIMGASAGLVFGYTVGISGGVTSMKSFLSKFFPGVLNKTVGTASNNYCKYDDQMLQVFTSSVFIAGLVGTFAAGYTSRKWGRLMTMRIAGLCVVVGSGICAVAPLLSVLILGRIVLGAGVGFSSQAGPLYLSEMAPRNFRGGLNVLYQIAIGVGIFVANLTNFGTQYVKGWGWRLSLGGGGVPGILVGLSSLVLLETPNSLIQRGRYEEGKRALQMVRGVEDVDNEYEDILAASELSQQFKNPYRNIFSRRARPQLVVGSLMQVFQQFTGINAILFYAPSLFETVGFGSKSSLFITVITGVVSLLSNLMAVVLVDKAGRRKLLVQGGVQMFVAMLAIGAILGIQLPATGKLPVQSAVPVVVFMCVFLIGFGYSWGPVALLIPTEIFPLEVRSAGQSINVFTNFFFTFVIAQCFLSMLCRLKYGIFIFFSTWIATMTWFVFFFLPETKGIPIEDMQQIWGRHWYWKKYVPELDILDQNMKANKNDLRKPHIRTDSVSPSPTYV